MDLYFIILYLYLLKQIDSYLHPVEIQLHRKGIRRFFYLDEICILCYIIYLFYKVSHNMDETPFSLCS
jgi:hypothetical protein